ncbi:MAG: zinc ribbon domain-containing protein [Opitutae bacterium]|nr:zinc ribbon domain-containing protein [Opitutae bacterium]
MPTYEYACLKCGKDFEVFQSMKDKPLAVCTCGKKGKVQRKIGRGAGLIFKGTGFYITDYKKTSAPKGESPKSDSAKTSSTENSSSSASKPAKKTPAAD